MRDDLITNILAESMSRDHVTVIEKLSEPKRDEEIATELNVKETIVRTLLNDLHIKNLVEYERTKNKKTGWYTYLWKKRDDRLRDYINSYLQNKLDNLNRKLDEETGSTLFKCACSRVPIERAMENEFICSECNEPYMEFDNTQDIREIETEIVRINNLIKSV